MSIAWAGGRHSSRSDCSFSFRLLPYCAVHAASLLESVDMDHHCESRHVMTVGSKVIELECDLQEGHQVKVHRQMVSGQKVAVWWLDGETESVIE